MARTRLWSAILRVPTADGPLWFKENAPALAFEPALTELLARRRPDCLPEVVAAAGPRLLTRHVGPSLREALEAGAVEPTWEEILPLLARLQIDTADLVDRALALGVPDARPPRLAERAERFLSRREVELVAGAVERLGATVPPMLAHEEAHEGNVFVRGGSAYLLDWAEACVSHPFAGTVLMLRAACERAGLEPGSAGVERLRDLYLEPFTGYAPLPELRDAYAEGYLLGTLCRVLTWSAIVGPHPPAVAAAAVGDPVGAWLRIFREVAAGTTRLGGA